jgi:hypothetical protein
MSLTGNLEIFPMPEVLRLLSRSKKTGCLRVDAADTHGRVYLAGGAITFANTESDEVIRQALINSGLVSDESLRNAGGSLVDAVVEGADPNAITDFVREQVVESLYRIRRPGVGDFEFAVDLQPSIQTGQQFDAEVAVAESERRAAEWADILQSIDSLDTPIRMVRELADENSVTIAAPTWRVLASLEGGTSVRELAYRAGMSEFRAARELSGLIKSELVTTVERRHGFDSGYQAPVVERRPSDAQPSSRFGDEPSPAPVQPPAAPVEPPAERFEPPAAPVDEFESFFNTTPVEEPSRPESAWETSPWDAPKQPEETNDSGSWFDEATGGRAEEADPVFSHDAGATEQAPAERQESPSDGGWWAAAMDQPERQPEGQSDPDSFLESVFSQLGEQEEQTEADDEDETGFSMGLLRRRRMGTAAKDITEG